MEGPKVVFVMCMTVVGVVYADHSKYHYCNDWRHTTLEEDPSIHLKQIDKAAVKCIKGRCIQKSRQPSKLWDTTREPKEYANDVFLKTSTALPETTTTAGGTHIDFDILEYWTGPPAQAETTTTKSPIDSGISSFWETYWDTTDDEPKPSWGSSVIIPIIAEPKSKQHKGRLSIKKKKDSAQKWDIPGYEPYMNELFSLN